MERAGPNDVAAISAIRTRRGEPLTGLLDGDAPVTLNQAKWLWVERWSGAARLDRGINSDSLSRHRFAGCNSSWTTTRNPLRNRPAQGLDLFDYSASTMMSVIAADAVAAAEDSALASYIESVHQPARSPGPAVRLERLLQFPRSEDLRHAGEGSQLYAAGTCTGVHGPYPIRQRIQVAARGSSAGQELAGRGVMEEARALVAADGVLLPPADRCGPRPMPHRQRETFGLLAAAPIEEARLALGWLGRYDRL